MHPIQRDVTLRRVLFFARDVHRKKRVSAGKGDRCCSVKSLFVTLLT